MLSRVGHAPVFRIKSRRIKILMVWLHRYIHRECAPLTCQRCLAQKGNFTGDLIDRNLLSPANKTHSHIIEFLLTILRRNNTFCRLLKYLKRKCWFSVCCCLIFEVHERRVSRTRDDRVSVSSKEAILAGIAPTEDYCFRFTWREAPGSDAYFSSGLSCNRTRHLSALLATIPPKN